MYILLMEKEQGRGINNCFKLVFAGEVRQGLLDILANHGMSNNQKLMLVKK